MTTAAPVIFVVDDDTSVLEALARLLAASEFEVRTFDSPGAFLEAHDPQVPGCAMFDVAMPGLNGLELQKALTERDVTRPIIFISGRSDIPTSVRAMKAGAVDFLTKPIEEEALLSAIAVAIRIDTEARERRASLVSLRRRFSMLTLRERQVFAHVATGRLNKQIAGDLGIAEKTIKFHRAHVMEKMGARSLADLVRMAERLELDLPPGH